MSDIIFGYVVTVPLVVMLLRRLNRQLPYRIWSPIYSIIYIYLIIGVTGWFFYSFAPSYIQDFYDIGNTRTQNAQALLCFFISIVFILFGAELYILFSAKYKVLNEQPFKAKYIKKRFAFILRKKNKIVYFLVAAIPILLISIGIGIENIFVRDYYIGHRNEYFVIAGTLLSMPAIFLLGLIHSYSTKLGWKIACIIFLGLYEALFLSMSSRRAAIACLFYIFGMALGGSRKRVLTILISIWIITLPLMIYLPLGLRSMRYQGLLAITTNVLDIFTVDFYLNYLDLTILFIKNITFGLPLTGYIKNIDPIPIENLVISINPLPSFIALPWIQSWSDVRMELRLSRFVPFNALGELSNYGLIWFSLYYLVVGIIATWVDIGTRIQIFLEKKAFGKIGYFVACALLGLFSITSTQYNLRSSTRMVYYALFIVLLSDFINKIKFRK